MAIRCGCSRKSWLFRQPGRSTDCALNNLRFRFVQAVQRPLVGARPVSVGECDAFETGPNGTVFTSGPWTLRLPAKARLRLLQAGFPFSSPVTGRGDISKRGPGTFIAIFRDPRRRREDLLEWRGLGVDLGA